MSDFSNIRIKTPGGSLYTTSSSSSDTTSANQTSSNLTSNSCNECLDTLVVNNMGAGFPLFKGKGTSNVLNFKTLATDSTMSITDNGNELILSSNSSGTVQPGATNLSQLSDVSVVVSDLKKDQVLSWNGTSWVASTIGTSGGSTPTALSQLTDVSVATNLLVKDQVLSWGGTSWVARTETPSTGVNSLVELTDVTVSSPTKGQVLTYNGTKWDAETPSSTEYSDPMLSSTFMAFIKVSIAPATDGPTGIEKLPQGWTAVISPNVYDITVTHPPGIKAVFMGCSVLDPIDDTVWNEVINGTRPQPVAFTYVCSQPKVKPNTFVIRAASNNNMQSQNDPDKVSYAYFNILMVKDYMDV